MNWFTLFCLALCIVAILVQIPVFTNRGSSSRDRRVATFWVAVNIVCVVLNVSKLLG